MNRRARGAEEEEKEEEEEEKKEGVPEGLTLIRGDVIGSGEGESPWERRAHIASAISLCRVSRMELRNS